MRVWSKENDFGGSLELERTKRKKEAAYFELNTPQLAAVGMVKKTT